MKYCACGCGSEIAEGRSFTHGHNQSKHGPANGHPVFRDRACACGCGGTVLASSQAGYYRKKFLPNHRPSGRNYYTPTAEEVPSGKCECGCGERTQIAPKTHRGRRWFRGYPKPFAGPGHRIDSHGPDHHLWKGGRYIRRGYVMVHAPDHPDADGKGYIPEHRLVMEKKVGRRLTCDEAVHHRNEKKDDNRPENLELLSKAEHALAHDKAGLMRSKLKRADYAAAGRKGAAARWNR